MTATPDPRKITLNGPGYAIRVFRGNPTSAVIARCDADDDAGLAPAAGAILDLVPATDAVVVTWDDPKRARLNAALLGAGLVVHRRKCCVTRDLAEPLPPGGTFTWRTLGESGDAEFLAVLDACSEGDPFEDATSRNPQREWEELLKHAGDALDRTLWRIALVDGAPAGVVLPTAWRGTQATGTLSYIGVLPAFRGRGLGRALHAEGLRLLAAAGTRSYRGSTDERNQPMVRVFERNGCTAKAPQLVLRRPS